MERLKLHLPASFLLVVFVGAFSLGVWQLRGQIQEDRRTRARLDRLNAECASLSQVMPVLGDEDELARDLVAAENAVRAARFNVGNRVIESAKTPLEAYFEISRGLEQLRAHALAAEVAVRSDESFGFAAFRGAGPAKEAVPVVLQQFHAVRELVEILFESRPLGLVMLQRLNPPGSPGQSSPTAGSVRLKGRTDQADLPPDYFEMAGELSLRLPDNYSGQAYRLVFSGQTRVLRDFLNRLAGHAQPVFVRSVEVEPLDVESTGLPTDSTAARLVPMVTRNISRFTVMLQLIDEANPPETPAA